MNPVSAVVVFIIIWWLVIFCVLPIGLGTKFDDNEDGMRAPGAPKTVNMKKKFLITTAISFVLWAVVIGVIYSGIIDIRALVFKGA